MAGIDAAIAVQIEAVARYRFDSPSTGARVVPAKVLKIGSVPARYNPDSVKTTQDEAYFTPISAPAQSAW